MTDREAMKMALEALERGTTGLAIRAIPALRQALAQPEQEPVAWLYNGHLHECDPSDWAEGEVKPLYTAPQSKPWVGLTDEECRHFNNRLSGSGVAEDIEFELKERNK